MKVWMQLHNAEERTYAQVSRVDDGDRSRVTIYEEHGVLAILDKGDLKNLLTDAE